MQKYLFIGLCLILTIACQSQEGELLQVFEEIKELGNSDPQQALEQLDSLSLDIEGQSVYVHAKYELLRVRLNDKAEVIPSNDKNIKRLISYFEDNGNIAEKQEALYYAGSIYRDLKDYPSAISNFLNSIEIAEDNHYLCDSLLLRNSYSNLSYLYNHVQDNQNYYVYALKEYRLAKQLDIIEEPNIMHLAEAYFILDSIDQAISLFDTVLVKQKNSGYKNIEVLSNLLYNYTNVLQIEKASECVALLDSVSAIESMDDLGLFAYGWYYYNTNQISKAEDCLKKIFERTDDLEWKYNVSRYLLYIYNDLGKLDKALSYGLFYAQISDTLNLGYNQQMAATVNNLYKYQRDKDEEQRVYDESQRNQRLAIGSVACIILLVIIGILMHVIHKNKHLQKVLMLTGELSSIKDAQKKLLLEVEQLKQQNENYDRLLHQVELQSKSSDIFNSLQQATIGLHKMNPDEWQQFYQVVDQQYPEFKKKMLAHLGSFSEKQMQFCYLLRMGFNKPEIENITDLTHVTVWRWEKKFVWIRKESDSDIIIHN